MARIAVVAFNLGGPASGDDVRPFLFNLFNDRAIIGLPQPLRFFLAKLIARRRAPVARAIYAKLGGGSPILENTMAQAAALEAALKDGSPGNEVRVFPCMRYWHPRAGEVAAAVLAFAPDRVVLLPLYPQFSTTTTASSLAEWHRAAGRRGLTARTTTVCCYPVEEGFVAALARLARGPWREALAQGPARLLMSAHGLPKRIVARGDPYPDQIEETARAVARRLALGDGEWRVCYQSRVGPLEWIGPATDEELRRAGRDKVAVVVLPLAFVSEHSETLVELDIEYRHVATAAGVPGYWRVPAVGTTPEFIAGLAGLVRRALEDPRPVVSHPGPRRCLADAGCCPQPIPRAGP